MSVGYINHNSGFYELPRLFKTDENGKIRVWQGFVRLISFYSMKNFKNIDWNLLSEDQILIEDSYFENLPDNIISQIWTETGILNGKLMRTAPTYPEPKNIGKKNFRNRLRQGISLIESKHKKKIEEGFHTECIKINLDYKFFPMLAKNWQDHKKDIVYPVFVQPKLDGIRAISCKRHNEIKLFSRTKKEFPSNSCNDLIKLSLNKIFKNFDNDGIYLDGELYDHDTKLQEINHLVRQNEIKDDNKLQYHIYDCFMVDQDLNIVKFSFEERIKFLNVIKENDIIRVVHTKLIESELELDELYSNFISLGYEGCMIRSKKGIYSGNQKNTTLRSKDLLKRKEIFTGEFKVVDYTTGTNSKEKNAIIWVCETKEKKTFKVTPNLSYKERYNLYRECENNFDIYKYRQLTIEYRGLSIDNIPLHSKGIIFRDE